MTIEYVIAAVVFFSIVLYVVGFLNSNISEYREDFRVNDLQSRAVQISDLLVHNRGVGISGGYPFISNSSLYSLNETCKNSYPGLLEQFDLIHKRIRIQINESETGNIMVDCGPAMPEKATKATMTRFGILDVTNEIITISLWVW